MTSARVAATLAALPDAVTATGFVLVWSSPFVFGPLSVKTAMLTMLVEFFLVHATGFFNVFAHDSGSKLRRSLCIVGLSSFYLMMISAFAWSFHAWWTLSAFAWLAVGKIIAIWSRSKDDTASKDDRMFWAMAGWAGSVVLFLGGCVLTSLLEVPRWGMTAALQPGFGLDMHSEGIWESQPHRVVAFGALYFGLTALAKLLSVPFAARKNGQHAPAKG